MPRPSVPSVALLLAVAAIAGCPAAPAPTPVEAVVRGFAGASGEHQVVIDSSVKDPTTGFPTGIKLRAELPGDDPDAAHRLEKAVRAELTVRCVVEAVPFGSIERATHKSRRVVYEA